MRNSGIFLRSRQGDSRLGTVPLTVDEYAQYEGVGKKLLGESKDGLVKFRSLFDGEVVIAIPETHPLFNYPTIFETRLPFSNMGSAAHSKALKMLQTLFSMIREKYIDIPYTKKS